MNIKLLATTIAATALIGCGGSSSSSPTPTPEVTPTPTPTTGNTAATFAGLTATAANDRTSDLTGTVVVTDPDAGEDTLVALTDEATSYGTFTIDATGSWSYTLDTDNDTVSGLASSSDTIVDTIEIESADGTTADISITITGTTAGSNRVAKIVDSYGIDNPPADSGELRYEIGSALPEGKLTVSFKKDDNAIGTETGEDDSNKSAYISLFGNSVTNSKAIADLNINSSNFSIRDQDGITVSVPFTPGVWQDVEMTWDATNASDTVGPEVNITIDGTLVATFNSAPTDLANIVDGVEYVVFKLGDNDSIIADAAFYVDDVKIYIDTEGTEANLTFQDNFDDDFNYTLGYSLDPDDDATNDPVITPYHRNTIDATVAEEE